ncbi:Cof-type HAD-IIB family hydrolase [Sporolactobacillus shoreicorticis]|uniref:Cof-type HAD-IIB family hydrolase n=1 Tax=Sporolactobacillus shoreicorticis TaxID=1923877 RepID=A0ABW5S1C2_9BACL|nr:Cof-type HAD-IIB family hydrolase [Sporolactobacillus shoreicorticis]MCO7124670.1 Cof-type HAD-IIB family hydrolase [Sporolactobacillus shoreicorticis]
MAGGKYKLMCIDVDGTLMDSNKDLPEINRKAIREAHSHGIKIAVASGRSPSSVQELIDTMGIQGYAICLNGAYTYIDDHKQKQVISRYALNKNQVNKVASVIDKYNARVFFSTSTSNITNKSVTDTQVTKIQKSVAGHRRLIVCNQREKLAEELATHSGSILKASIMEPDEKKYYKIRLELEAAQLFNVAQSDLNYIDVNRRGVNKAIGVSDLANHLNIDLSCVICVGDNENDIQMIKSAGMGVAMANACHELLKVSDAVTLSNDECGVAKVIYDYVLA